MFYLINKIFLNLLISITKLLSPKTVVNYRNTNKINSENYKSYINSTCNESSNLFNLYSQHKVKLASVVLLISEKTHFKNQ